MKRSTITGLALIAGVLMAVGGINALSVNALADGTEKTVTGNTTPGDAGSTTTPGDAGSTTSPETDPTTSPSVTGNAGTPTPTPFIPDSEPTTAPSTEPTTAPTTAPSSTNTSSGSTSSGSTNESSKSDSSEPAKLVVNVDWTVVANEINAALLNTAVGNVEVVAGTEYTIPASILNSVAGEDKALMLHAGNGMALSISGQDVVAGSQLKIDMAMTADVPAAVKNVVTNNSLDTREFALKEDTVLPFKVDFHVHIGEEFAGKYAVLYRYNAVENVMERVNYFKVTEQGQALFALTEIGEYVIVVTEEQP